MIPLPNISNRECPQEYRGIPGDVFGMERPIGLTDEEFDAYRWRQHFYNRLHKKSNLQLFKEKINKI